VVNKLIVCPKNDILYIKSTFVDMQNEKYYEFKRTLMDNQIDKYHTRKTTKTANIINEEQPK
jgi:hypothetical protein